MTAAIGIATFIVSGRPQASAAASRNARASATCGPLTPRASASSRMRSARGSSGRWTGWPKPGSLPPAARMLARELGAATCRAARRRRPARCASSSSRAHSSDVPRITGPQPRIPAATAPWSEPGVGGERHPRGDVRGHHPVLGDRDEQQVEEEALVLGRLVAGEQQVEVLGEAQPAHEVAGEVAPADLDAVGIGLADVADRRAGLADLRHRRDATATGDDGLANRAPRSVH